MTKKLLIFEDRLGFVDGDAHLSLEITKKDGSSLVPEEEIELNIEKEDWESLKEDEKEVFKELAP